MRVGKNEWSGNVNTRQSSCAQLKPSVRSEGIKMRFWPFFLKKEKDVQAAEDATDQIKRDLAALRARLLEDTTSQTVEVRGSGQ